jgi:hypothetical protein
MPEFIGFRTSLGTKPKKKPFRPNCLKQRVPNVTKDSLPLFKLNWLLRTSKGWETVMATTPAMKAGRKVAS